MENQEGHFELSEKQQLREKYDSLQMKYLAALEVGNDAEVLEIKSEMDEVAKELGIDEAKLAA